MEKTLQCPKCGSTEIEVRDHNKLLKTTGGVLMTAAGTTAGTVGGAATGASVGATIGTVAGPLGVIVGGTIGTFVGAISVGITGGIVGNIFGKKAGGPYGLPIYTNGCDFSSSVSQLYRPYHRAKIGIPWALSI